MKALNSALLNVQRHLGVRADIAIAFALLVLAAASVGFTLVTHTGTPAGAALAYMAAVDRADTDFVWSHSIINTANAAGPGSFLDRAALDAQLKATARSRSAFTVQQLRYTSQGTVIKMAYNTVAGPQVVNLTMRGGAPHSWPVLVDPAGLAIAVPSGVGAISLAGRTVEPNGDQLRLAVFPGSHRIAIAPSALYQAFDTSVDVESIFPAMTEASLSKLLLKDSAVAQGKQAVASAIQACAASNALVPSNCPQAYTSDVTNGAASWAALGDQTAEAVIGVNYQSQLQATGSYLMKLSYTSVTHGARVVAVGGSYSASLKWDGQALSVASFSGAPPRLTVTKPSAANGDVLSALKAQFSHCLSLQAGSAPDCPQTVAAYFASNFVWHAAVDPTQEAAVTWDTTQGFFKVSGTFDFTVDYDSTPPLSPTRHYQDHSGGQYTADLYWDGAKAVFIGFE